MASRLATKRMRQYWQSPTGRAQKTAQDAVHHAQQAAWHAARQHTHTCQRCGVVHACEGRGCVETPGEPDRLRTPAEFMRCEECRLA